MPKRDAKASPSVKSAVERRVKAWALTLRLCPKCGKEGEFWKGRSNCKACMREISTRWYRQNADLINERRRLRYWERIGPFTRKYVPKLRLLRPVKGARG